MAPSIPRVTRRLLLVALSAPLAAAQTPLEQEVALLSAANGGQGDAFGSAVALHGGVAVVGAVNAHVGSSTGQGSAWVFRWDGAGWVEEQQLAAAGGQPVDSFGASVAVHADVVVVGVDRDDVAGNLNQGSASVFRWNGSAWVEEQQLLAGDGDASDAFGRAVAVDGDVIVVGAAADEVGLQEFQGSAYVFRRDGDAWVQEQKLVAAAGAGLDLFGTSVSVSGDVIVVGAPGHSLAPGEDQGAAFVFRRDGSSWVEEQRLGASDGQPLDQFGHSVAASGDVIVAGAFLDDVGTAAERGSATVFRWNGSAWAQQQQLVASDGDPGDQFGVSVAVSGDRAVVGAQFGDVGSTSTTGAAYLYLFRGSGWVEDHKLVASDGQSTDMLGGSVAVSGAVAVAGAMRDDSGSQGDQGSAYVFDLLGESFTWLGQALAGAGGLPVLATLGNLVPGSPVAFVLSQARPNAAVFPVVGLAGPSVPFKGGVLVPSPDLVLAGLVTDAQGGLTLPATWPAGIPPGFAFWMQEWIVDPAGPAGFAASNALAAMSS